MSTTPIDYTALAKQAGAVDSQPAPSQGAPVDYTALAKQAGAVDSQPAPSTPAAPDQGILSKVGDFAKGIIPGAVQSAGETIQSLPYVGKKIISPEAMQSEREYFAPGSAAEKAGQTTGEGMESLMEFVLGDEALKGVSLSQKIGLASKITKLAQDSPYLAKLLEHGAAAARQGTVGAIEAKAKGATNTQALETGAVAGIGGEALSAAGEALSPYVKPVVNALKNPWRTTTAAASAVSDVAHSIASKFTGSEIQPELKAGIQDVWNDVAEKAGVPKPTTKSVQDAGHEVGDSILARSKANYKMIDDATGGRFSGTEQQIKTVNDDLRYVTNDTDESALMVRKTRLEMQMDQMMDEAETKGVTKDHVDAAKQDFKQAQAIYDTNHQIRMATKGVRPGKPGALDVPESTDAKSLMNRFNKLLDKGRVQQAVGADNADELIKHTAVAQSAANKVARNKTIAKYAVPSAAGVAGTAYEILK